MINSYPAQNVNQEFINIKIQRAFEGISYLQVVNSGKFYALLRLRNDGCNFVYQNNLGLWKSKRSYTAMYTIFNGLIFRYYNFECDNARYHLNRNDGLWYWSEVV